MKTEAPLTPSSNPSLKEYLFIYLALMFLLGLTLASSFVDLGSYNMVANLGISGLKTALVVVFFMHLKGSPSLTKVFALAGIFWLGILFSLAATDYLSRAWTTLPGHWPQPNLKVQENPPQSRTEKERVARHV
jgi:cytochrome c oxidase subunit 4